MQSQYPIEPSSASIPALTTEETQRIRQDYPCIEHLEAGNIAPWLVERQDQLLVRARDERTGMNLAKLITLSGGAVGAICYATSPLALIGAAIAGVGYIWAVAQDANDTHQFAPIPFIRGNIIEFLSAMGDTAAREEWFANQNELVDLMNHLPPLERYEFGMLKGHTHTLANFLSGVDAGKRFYAYRWLLDWFIHLKGGFPSQEQLQEHLRNVSNDPRINYDQVGAIASHLNTAKALSSHAPKEVKSFSPAPEISSSTDRPLETEAIDITDRVVPPAVDKYKWVDNFISNTALVWANQGGGKSWFVRYLAKLKKDRGYRVIVLDPDSNAVEWQGLESYHDFKDIERVLNWYLEELESRYREFNHSQIKEEEWRRKLWAEGKAISLICEEMTTYTDFIQDQKMLSRFVRIGATKSRKQEMPITFVTHNNTQSCLGNISGLGNLIAKLLQLELFAEVDSVSLQPQASGKGAVKLDSSLEWRGVEIPKLDNKITVFGEGIKTTKEVAPETPKFPEKDMEDETEVPEVPEETAESIEAERKRLEEVLNLEYEGDSGREELSFRPLPSDRFRPSVTSDSSQEDPDREVFEQMKIGRKDGRSKTQMCMEIYKCSDGGRDYQRATADFERIRTKFLHEWVAELHQEGMNKSQVIERIYGIHRLKQDGYKKKKPQEWAKINEQIDPILEEIEFGND